MTSITDFVDENQRVNVGKYRQALRDAGEACNSCNGFISHPNGSPTVCYNCRTLSSREQMANDQCVRCPNCGHEFNVWQHTDYYLLWDSGTHPVECTECNTQFDIQTQITYTFVSPAMKDHNG